jgi:hypothetical protein
VNYFRYYDVAGNKWVKQCPTPCGALGGNPGLVFDPIAKKLITFGGWGGGQNTTLTYGATAVPGTSWVAMSPRVGLPDFGRGDAAKETSVRTMWDSRRHRVTYVHEDGAFLDLHCRR